MRKNFTVGYAYCTKEGRFGIVTRRMELDEIDFLFKSVSVEKCRDWIAPVKALRRGGTVRVNAAEQAETGTIFLKGWEIERIS